MAIARFKDLCLDALDATVVATFWAALLDRSFALGDDGDAVLHGASEHETLWINVVPEPKSAKNRVHLDLVLDSLDRVVELGGSVVARHEAWTVVADPEGNEFCIFPPGVGEPSALDVDSTHPVELTRWWAELLDAEPTPGPDGGLRWLRGVPHLPYDCWKFVQAEESKSLKNRMHWDLDADAIEPLLDHGARLLRRPDADIRWHVLADPEGNEFCVFLT